MLVNCWLDAAADAAVLSQEACSYVVELSYSICRRKGRAVKQCRQCEEKRFSGNGVLDFGGVVSIRFCCAASVGKRRALLVEMKCVDLILIKFYLFIFYIRICRMSEWQF